MQTKQSQTSMLPEEQSGPILFAGFIQQIFIDYYDGFVQIINWKSPIKTIYFKKNYFRNTIRVSNGFDSDLDLQNSPGPKVIKRFSCSTQLGTTFQLLIRTKIRINEEVSCFRTLRCSIHHANKC